MLTPLSPVIPRPLRLNAGLVATAVLVAVLTIVALTALCVTDAMAWMPASGEPRQCHLDEYDRWVCD